MRKFLFIFACSLSFCVRAEVYTVSLDEDQLDEIFWGGYTTYILNTLTNGSFQVQSESNSPFPHALSRVMYNQRTVMALLHLIMSGDLTGSYDVENNNILAYASSLRQHNENVRQMLEGISDDVYTIWDIVRGFPSHYLRQYDLVSAFRSDFGSYTNNIDKIYAAITNLNLNVSFTNQIDILQSLGSISNNTDNLSNLLAQISQHIRNFNDDFVSGHTALDLEEAIRDMELLNFLHSLTNGTLFASNLCNCCSNTNFQDGVLGMLDWMTNNFPDAADSAIGGGGSSNNVWWVWRPSDSGWRNIFIPKVGWQEDTDGFGYVPFYGAKRDQYDQNFLEISQQYANLIQEYEMGGIDGQKFFTGLVDLQLHILANMSTQLYMIDNKMPSKTNLWQWIENYIDEVQYEVQNAESENQSAIDTARSLLDYTPFTTVNRQFPKVSNALNNLKLEDSASNVLHLPIPRALRTSDSDTLTVDVGESEWYSSGRTWCRWVFSFIWGYLFIRLGIVPIFYIFFFTLRVAEISAHLVLMGSVRGSSGVVSSMGASAVDMVLSLIGIDTDFKKFVWGIMRD